MGKYIKYFEDENAFAEWLNFGEKEEGPDGAPSTFVAYVGENDTLYYEHSDVSGYELLFEPQNSEIDATAETVTFDIKTGSFWLDVYHNGELVGEYIPGLDKHYNYSVDANMTPLTVQEVFTGQWFKDNNGEKGEYIQTWDRSVTHKPDPYAEPVKLTCVAVYTSDGQNPTRLGNGSLSGATRIYYSDEAQGADVDILNDVYVQSKRLWYQFPAEGDYEVYFEFEDENQTVRDYFIYSQATYLDIYTNYPELGAQTNFRFNGPLMGSTIEELQLGEGMQYVNAVMMANSLSAITLDDSNRLPEINVQLLGVANEGAIFCDENAENFSMWQAAKPAGWYINSTGLGAWFGSSSTFPSSGGSDTIYLSFGLPINDHFKLTVDSGNGHFNNQSGPTTVTGDTNSLSTGVTFYAEVNTGETYQGMISVLAYDADGNERDSISLSYTVEGEVVPPAPTLNSLSATTVFITTQANQTVAVPNGSGFNHNEYCGVFYNGVNILNDVSGGYYTFAEAGEHTLVYVRSVDGDFDLQGWLQSPDMISCSIASDNNQAWGFHGNENGYTFSGCTSLTGVTFDENCYLIGNYGGTANTTFIGCTALTSITCYSAVSPVNNAGDFETITSNTGTLHIPSGADYSAWATALGNSWSVQDDL